MIGLIQKVLMELLTDVGGDDLRQRVLRRAGLPEDQSFRLDRDYPDEDVLALLAATEVETGLPRSEVDTLYAKAFLVRAQVMFPRFFARANSAAEFMRMQPTIHASLGSGLRDAEARSRVADKFSPEPVRPGEDPVVSYSSPNRLCGLYRALAVEVATLFGETCAPETLACRARDGGAACRFRFPFRPAVASAEAA